MEGFKNILRLKTVSTSCHGDWGGVLGHVEKLKKHYPNLRLSHLCTEISHLPLKTCSKVILPELPTPNIKKVPPLWRH
jgi:hypothetical protein